MKLGEAILYVDEMKPHNQYTKSRKVKWLSKLDELIYKEIILTHKHEDDVTFTGYDDDTDEDTELIVPSPYDELYRYYLESEIDYANFETDKFNNSVAMYNEKMSQFRNYYNRNNTPLY